MENEKLCLYVGQLYLYFEIIKSFLLSSSCFYQASIFFMVFFLKSIIAFSHYYLQPQYICKSCKGRRVVLGTKSVKINIMSGIDFFNIVFLGTDGCISKVPSCG